MYKFTLELECDGIKMPYVLQYADDFSSDDPEVFARLKSCGARTRWSFFTQSFVARHMQPGHNTVREIMETLDAHCDAGTSFKLTGETKQGRLDIKPELNNINEALAARAGITLR